MSCRSSRASLLAVTSKSNDAVWMTLKPFFYRRSARGVLSFGLLCAAACSTLVDGALSGKPRVGTDGGTSTIDARVSNDSSTSDVAATIDALVDARVSIDVPPQRCTTVADCNDRDLCNGMEDCREGVCVSAAAMADGVACDADGNPASADVCVARRCVRSRCGDGVTDTQTLAMEQCDDANTVDSDGCRADCKFTCSSAVDCDDANPCNGTEACGADHRCTPSETRPADGSACTTGTVSAGTCRTQLCQPQGCGDGVINGTEQCDDRNGDPTDGCRSDCMYSCQGDMDCEGMTRCDALARTPFSCRQVSGDGGVTGQRCEAQPVENCDDALACTTDLCRIAGCEHAVIDADGDGRSPGNCADTYNAGMDCDDSNPARFPGNPEVCDGIDNDCNAAVDDNTSTQNFYLDADGDGFGASGSTAIVSCMPPTDPPGNAQYVTNERDCYDLDPQVRPNQNNFFNSPNSRAGSLRFDYNCDGLPERQYDQVRSCSTTGCNLRLCLSPSSPRCCGAGLSGRDVTGYLGSVPNCGLPFDMYRCASGAVSSCQPSGVTCESLLASAEPYRAGVTMGCR